jgi:hypothetical protein
VSNNLNLSQVAAAQNQKEVTINDQAAQLDAALTEQCVADVAAGNVALTATHYRRAVHIKAIGAATSGRTVTLQAIKKLSIISNWSTTDSVDFGLGTATITLGPAEQAANPTMALVYTDGTANGLFAVNSGIGGGSIDALDDIGDVDISGLQAGDMLRRNGSNQWVAERTPFLLSMFIPGLHGNGALMAQIVFDRIVAFDEDLPGSAGYAQAAAAAETVLDIQKNGANVGTITFTDAGNAATFALAGGASFAAGDRLAIINENPADSTLADLSITLRGRRV